MSTSNGHQSQPITQIPSRSPIPQTATLTPAPVLQICPPAPDTMTHPLSTGTAPADASSSHHTTSLEAQRTGGTSNADAQGIVTPPVPMVHLRALVISGESHVFTFEPETTVGRTKELIWSMWPSHWREPSQPPSPSFLRILHAGRILSDDSTLSSNNLPAALPPATPTVIHLSVRSFSIRAEDEPKKGSNLHPVNSRSGRNADEEVSGCKCVIM